MAPSCGWASFLPAQHPVTFTRRFIYQAGSTSLTLGPGCLLPPIVVVGQPSSYPVGHHGIGIRSHAGQVHCVQVQQVTRNGRFVRSFIRPGSVSISISGHGCGVAGSGHHVQWNGMFSCACAYLLSRLVTTTWLLEDVPLLRSVTPSIPLLYCRAMYCYHVC